MKKQILMMIRFKNAEDVKNIKFEDVFENIEIKGHKFFNIEGKENVLFSNIFSATEGESFVLTNEGVYNSVFAKNIHGSSIYDIKEVIKDVKTSSKNLIKTRSFSVRKSTKNKKNIPKGEWSFASFNIDADKIEEYKKDENFFNKISEFLNGDRIDFLGKIDGINIEPIKFKGNNILESNNVVLVKLNGGTYFSNKSISNLRSEVQIIERKENDYPHRSSDFNDDIGMRLFLEANGYELIAIKNK